MLASLNRSLSQSIFEEYYSSKTFDFIEITLDQLRELQNNSDQEIIQNMFEVRQKSFTNSIQYNNKINNANSQSTGKIKTTEQQNMQIISGQYKVSLANKNLFIERTTEEFTYSGYIDIEFSKLCFLENSGESGYGFRVQKYDTAYEFYFQDEGIDEDIKQQWAELLDKYAIRKFNSTSFKMGKELGKGSYSKVIKVGITQDCIFKSFALKIINKNPFQDDQLREQLINEIRLQRGLNCGNIVKINQVLEDEEHIYLLLDYIEGGTLREQIKKGMRIREYQIRQITTQLLLSADYMQGRQILHRDLKPENIILSFNQNSNNPDAFIADFGFAVQLTEDSQIGNIFGTPGFVAPEILKGHQYTFKSDIFSIGSIIYNIIAGTSLFKGKTAKEALQENMKCQVERQIERLMCSTNCKEFLSQMLASTPFERPTASEALQHQWFSDDIEAINFSLGINQLENKSRRDDVSPFSQNSSTMNKSVGKYQCIENDSCLKKRPLSQFRQATYQNLLSRPQPQIESNQLLNLNPSLGLGLQLKNSVDCTSNRSRSKRITFNQLMNDYNHSKKFNIQDSDDLQQKSSEFTSIHQLNKQILNSKIKGEENQVVDQSFQNQRQPYFQQIQSRLLLQAKSASYNVPKANEKKRKRIDPSQFKKAILAKQQILKESFIDTILEKNMIDSQIKDGSIKEENIKVQTDKKFMIPIQKKKISSVDAVYQSGTINEKDFDEGILNFDRSIEKQRTNSFSKYGKDGPVIGLETINVQRKQRIFV